LLSSYFRDFVQKESGQVVRLQEQCGKLEESCWTGREILVIHQACGRDSQAHKRGRTPCDTGVTAECAEHGPYSIAPDKETKV
jgi:hypothetical protein